MTKLSITTVTVLGLIFTPFPYAEAGPPQDIVKSHSSSGPSEEDQERLIEEVLRLLGPNAGSPGQRTEDEERVLEEVLRLLNAEAAESGQMLEGEEEDGADLDKDRGKKQSKKDKDKGKKQSKKDKDRGKKQSKKDRELSDAGSSAGVAKGDFNGDGFADLAVGVPSEDVVVSFFDPVSSTFRQENRSNAGAVNVIYGSAGGLTAGSTTVPTNQFWTQFAGAIQFFPFPGLLDVPETDDNFGAAVAAGDFNRDGFSDLAVAVPGERTIIPGTTTSVRGAVQILYGSANGLTGIGDQLITLPELFDSAATESTLRVGNALVWGDFNGDGFGDLAVEGQNNNGPDIARLSVLFGSAAGLNRGVARKDFPFPNAVSNGGAELFGTDMALAAGKLNGDQFDDIVVGLPDENVGTALDAGAVHILFGSSAGPTTAGSQVFNQDSRQEIFEVPDRAETFDHFGQTVAVGDFNGDGFADLAVGVPFEDLNVSGGTLNGVTDAGVVHIFFGTSGGLVIIGSQFFQQGSTANITGQGEKRAESGDRFGSALAAGDFNADGVADLAIGAPGETLLGLANAGAVTVLHGAADVGLSTMAGPGEQFWTESSASGNTVAPVAGDSFGRALTAWNFGRNQIITFPQLRFVFASDLAIGIPGKDVGGQNDAGAVRVIYGSISGLSTAAGFIGAVGPSQLWTQDSPGVRDQAEISDRFGSALY